MRGDADGTCRGRTVKASRALWKRARLLGVVTLCCVIVAGCSWRPKEVGYRFLFGEVLFAGWELGPGAASAFSVENGSLICRQGEGRMLTEREYADFSLRFEFQTEEGGFCGLALRASMEGDPSILGLEMQLGPGALGGDRAGLGGHGRLSGIAEASGGYFLGGDRWNQQEVICQGRRVRSTLNGRVLLDVDLNQLGDKRLLLMRPGVLRERGRVGLVSRGGGGMRFRNVRIKELPKPYLVNVAPDGFTALFDGRSFRNWQGLVEPPTRAKLGPGDYRVEQIRADYVMTLNWQVENGVLSYVGKGFDNLCTVRHFGDFELMVDWRIEEVSDSGIYLRGTPQVQIWDRPVGSGGLFNNEKHASEPLKRADRLVGSWNRFRIVMVGERVTVTLNDELVVRNVVMENYWDRAEPIVPRGPIELQAHETPVSFRNVYVREL
jgi:hypothetical protein